MLALFSLAGIPPFAGFFSKFFVFMASWGGGFVVLTIVALVNTVISLFYYLKVIKAMFLEESDDAIPTLRSDCPAKISLVVCMLGVLFLGVASFVFGQIVTLAGVS